MKAFIVPITVQVRIEIEDEVETEVARAAADVVSQFLAKRIQDTLVPKPGVIRVIDTEVGYPTHTGGDA